MFAPVATFLLVVSIWVSPPKEMCECECDPTQFLFVMIVKLYHDFCS